MVVGVEETRISYLWMRINRMETAKADPKLPMMLSDWQVVEGLVELLFRRTAILYCSKLSLDSRAVGETMQISFLHPKWLASRGTRQQCSYSTSWMNPMHYTEFV